MKIIADRIDYNPTEVNSKDTLRKIQRHWIDEDDKRIKFMPIVHEPYSMNAVGSSYKYLLDWGCGGWRWKIIRYKGQNYIGGINLTKFRLYRGKVNVIDAMKFLNNHLTLSAFNGSSFYAKIVYPVLK